MEPFPGGKAFPTPKRRNGRNVQVSGDRWAFAIYQDDILPVCDRGRIIVENPMQYRISMSNRVRDCDLLFLSTNRSQWKVRLSCAFERSRDFPNCWVYRVIPLLDEKG
jgi:hypothetical protein